MNGAKKTHIVYEVNLNFNIAQKYLEMLKERELIKHENGLFITTDKGKVFQEMAKELISKCNYVLVSLICCNLKTFLA
jgi:predicted transcriptional regulator